MRRHKRLREGFAERLVPQGWPFTPEMQAPPLINAGYRRSPLVPRLAEGALGAVDGNFGQSQGSACTSAGQPKSEAGCGFAASSASSGNAQGAPLPGSAFAGGVNSSDSRLSGALSTACYCDIWIQAASGGEAYLTWEILRLLAASGGGLRVLCTTCTRQGLEVLHKAQQELELASIDITVNYLPLDEPPLMRRAVQQVFGPKPQSVVAQGKSGATQQNDGTGRCCSGAVMGGAAQLGDTAGASLSGEAGASLSVEANASRGGATGAFSGVTAPDATVGAPLGATAGGSSATEAGGFAYSAAGQTDMSAFTRGRVLVLLETEIWPGLLAACSQAGVRVLVLNARMTEGSFKAYRFLAPLLRRHAPHGILATTEGDLERFCRIFDGKFAKVEKMSLESKSVGHFSAESGKNFADSGTASQNAMDFANNSADDHCVDPNQSGSDPVDSEQSDSDQIESGRFASGELASGHFDSGEFEPGHSGSGQSGSRQLAPERSAPGQLAPGRSASGQLAAGWHDRERSASEPSTLVQSGPIRGLMHNIKFDRVFMGGEIKKKDPAKRPASGIAPYPPGAEASCAVPSGTALSAGRSAQSCGAGDSGSQNGAMQVAQSDDLLSADLAVEFSAGSPVILSAKNAEITTGVSTANSLSSVASSGECATSSPSHLAPLLLASVREEEEELLLEVLHELRTKRPDLPIVIAPRHMHRVPAWEAALEKAAHAADAVSNLPASASQAAPLLYSKRSDFADVASALRLRPGEVRIWDAFGEMDQLYRAACAVFVGGSLAPLGGQNFLEPLGVGLIPVIGPYWSNFYWAGTEIFEMNLARRVENAGQLATTLLDLAVNPRPRPDVIRDFNAYLTPRRGGTRQAVQLIMETVLS
ncbi:hypothetical protein LJC48_06400 [Desulfovibrio sp. OttesenSCG-928-C06]|nr:hypothetical protein [Desulfovibrio sp. OttesenSCG-928-C06]